MIRQASERDNSIVSALALRLWPDHSPQEMKNYFSSALASDNGAVFLYFVQLQPVAFAQCQLRHDYVEGTQSGPVGYLEGIFVAQEHRRQGIAMELLRHCEQWAKSKGCNEFASACKLENADSLLFHLHAGFSEANRIICFTKKL